MASLPGDQDAVDAHIDSCLAHAAMTAEDAAARAQLGTPDDMSEDGWEEVEVDGAVRLRPGGRVLRASGIHVRVGDAEADVDEDIDVDGDDAVAFGTAQFTEADVVDLGDAGPTVDVDEDVDIDGDEDAEDTLRKLVQAVQVAQPDGLEECIEVDVDIEVDVNEGARPPEQAGTSEELAAVDAAIGAARRSRNPESLIRALETKIRVIVSTSDISSDLPDDLHSNLHRQSLPVLFSAAFAWTFTQSRLSVLAVGTPAVVHAGCTV
jgi:hypothetical protein